MNWAAFQIIGTIMYFSPRHSPEEIVLFSVSLSLFGVFLIRRKKTESRVHFLTLSLEEGSVYFPYFLSVDSNNISEFMFIL
jgi:hypothetical protein